MNVIDLIQNNKGTAFSFEVLPPLKGTGIEKLFHTIDTLREFDPKYINITNHRSEFVYKDMGNGLMQRSRQRRRPGTVAVAAAIQQHYGIHVVPHILCSGFTREDTEYLLLDLQFLGISDLLVLRGDKAKEDAMFKPTGDGYSHATELIEHINTYNKGLFIDGSPIKNPGVPFSYGVACYPEKHEEAPNLETDLEYFKACPDAVVNVTGGAEDGAGLPLNISPLISSRCREIRKKQEINAKFIRDILIRPAVVVAVILALIGIWKLIDMLFS